MKMNLSAILGGILALVALVSCEKVPGNDYYAPSFPKQEKPAEIPAEGGLCYFLVQYQLEKANTVQSKYQPEIVWKSFRYRIDFNAIEGDELIVNTVWDIPAWPYGMANPGNEAEYLYAVPFNMPANQDYASNEVKVYVSVDNVYTNSVLAHEWSAWKLVYEGVQAGLPL